MFDDHSINTSIDQSLEQAEKEKKRRWRLSRSRNADGSTSSHAGVTSPRMTIGSNDNAEISNLSISSSSHAPRKSESSNRPNVVGDARGSFDYGKDRDESKGPIGWIRNKYREAKENAEQRRNKSPPPDRVNLNATSFPSRGKSLDMKRDAPRETEKQQTAPGPQPTAAPVPTASPKSNAISAPQSATISLVPQQPTQGQLAVQPSTQPPVQPATQLATQPAVQPAAQPTSQSQQQTQQQQPEPAAIPQVAPVTATDANMTSTPMTAPAVAPAATTTAPVPEATPEPASAPTQLQQVEKDVLQPAEQKEVVQETKEVAETQKVPDAAPAPVLEPVKEQPQEQSSSAATQPTIDAQTVPTEAPKQER